jgi:1-acyl-sn-glycerol-3-phosphate acyltransferase
MLPWMRSWGHVPLWALGVRLDVRGLERRDAPGAKIVVFNHASLLDLFVLAALCPPRPIVLYKKELGRIPGLGWALSSLGMVSLDRSNHVAAIQSVAAAGERMRAEGASLIMAPEGTRSRRGGLQAFKLGAFHLATSTGVPLTPMILRGTASVLPMGSILARSGVVRVDFLASIESDDWRVEDVRAHAAEVREVFLGTLASEMP